MVITRDIQCCVEVGVDHGVRALYASCQNLLRQHEANQYHDIVYGTLWLREQLWRPTGQLSRHGLKYGEWQAKIESHENGINN
jgi:hypothetical protein